jgi:predicted MFS family arabinose efflux permease
MIGFGVGEVLGGFILGLISDWIGMKATSFVNVAIILAMIGVTVVNII